MEKVLRVQDLGHLGMSRQMVKNQIHKGELPAYKIGRDYYIKDSDVDEWLKKNIAKKK